MDIENIKNHDKYKDIITMCSLDKINFVYNYTLNNFKNIGDIFEIGTFAGAITQSLALASEKFKPNIYTVDKFEWDNDKKKKFPNLSFQIKDDFSNYVINSLSHFENIKIFKSNFVDLKPNNQIELMFIDAPKRMKYVIQLIRIFSNYWIENNTKLLFEDYNQFLSYELPATLFPIKKNFRFHTNRSDIVVAEFLKNKIDVKDYKLMNIRKWDIQEIKNNWDEIHNIGDNAKYIDKEISIFMHLFDNNFFDEAISYARERKINFENYKIKNKFIKNYLSKIEKI